VWSNRNGCSVGVLDRVAQSVWGEHKPQSRGC
jgi:hypothetical protein